MKKILGAYMVDEEGRREPFIALPRGVLSQGSDAWFPGDFPTASTYAALVNDANWCDGTAPLPRQGMPLKTGQLVIGLRSWSEAHFISVQELRTILDKLKRCGKINTRSNTQGTLVTINDYDKLFLNRPDGQHTQQQTINTRSTHEQHNQDLGQRDKESPLSPPTGGARAKPHLRSLRRKPAPCPCCNSGEVPIRRLGTDGQWEASFAGCPDCPDGASRWALGDAAKYGWERTPASRDDGTLP